MNQNRDGFSILLTNESKPRCNSKKSMKNRDGFRILLTIWSSIGAIENEFIEIGSEDRKPTLTRIGFECGVNHRSNKLVLIDDESDRTSTPKHGNTNQEPVGLGVLVLLWLVQQHRRKKKSTTKSKWKNKIETQKKNFQESRTGCWKWLWRLENKEKNWKETENGKEQKLGRESSGVDAEAAVVPAFLARSESESDNSARPCLEKGEHQIATAWDFHHSQQPVFESLMMV